MPLQLLVLFVVGSLLELYVLLWISKWISIMNTFSIIMLTFLVGVVVGRSWGKENFDKIQWKLKSRNLPPEDMLNAVVMATASMLLITPGVITDFIGLFVLIPATRPMFKEMLLDYMKKKIASGDMHFFIKD